MKYLALGATLLASLPVGAGVFSFVDSGAIDNFSIVHPPTFDGSGGTLTVRVCLDRGSEQLAEPLRQAVQVWNNLARTTQNCTGCAVVEEPQPVEGLYDPFAVLVHELGHCAMGLGHINWEFDDGMGGMLRTSSTNTNAASVILEGDDDIKGTLDDQPLPFPGARLIHWFREGDNNPAVIDGTVIDETTFTRTHASLPVGHTWAASSNRAANETLGLIDTHSAMYSNLARGAVLTGLSADEVNTVHFGMTGLDETAGTDDDYTVVLQVTTGCDGPDDIRVRFADDLAQDELGVCISRFRAVPDPPKQLQHYAVTNEPFTTPIEIKLDINTDWDFSRIYSEGFESGDLSQWDIVVP